MKHLYTFLVLAFLAQFNAAAQCGAQQVITLANQSQVDAFATRFPGCTEFSGALLVTGNNITNLNALASFTKFGELGIFNCPLLQNLNGLDNVTSVGNLNITNNAILTNIVALSNLTQITRGLAIGNGVLTDLHGLEGVTAIGGLLSLSGNGLVSVRGLDNVQSIGSYFEMSNSTTISDLTALRNLRSIGLYVNFSNMQALASLSGLDNVTFTADRPINISNCPNLTMCSVLGVCRFLDAGGTGTIRNNGVGCSTIQEIEDRCTNMAAENFEKTQLVMYPNPATDDVVIHYDGDVTETTVSISDLTGKQVFRSPLSQDFKVNLQGFMAGMYIVKVNSQNRTSQYKLLKL